MNKQKERYQRGENFQDEIRRSWRRLSNLWRLRIEDSSGSRPGDELILTMDPEGRPINILAEHKRTSDNKFNLSDLRQGQVKGLIDFESVLPWNFGLVFVNFLNRDQDRDITYAFRLVKAIEYMKEKDRASVPLKDFVSEVPALQIPVLEGVIPRTYDMRGVLYCYQLL